MLNKWAKNTIFQQTSAPVQLLTFSTAWGTSFLKLYGSYPRNIKTRTNRGCFASNAILKNHRRDTWDLNKFWNLFKYECLVKFRVKDIGKGFIFLQLGCSREIGKDVKKILNHYSSFKYYFYFEHFV